ncbi:unnamed protein product [Linum trigynum]|uniref:Uncharacterized protein n=1 Tax=Linum trigynum TaxID=586398 RepID=A0AAV2C6D0_9ROSI
MTTKSRSGDHLFETGVQQLGSGTSWASDSGRTADCRRERIATRRNENWREGEEDPGGRLRRGGMMRSSAGEEESSGIRSAVMSTSKPSLSSMVNGPGRVVKLFGFIL